MTYQEHLRRLRVLFGAGIVITIAMIVFGRQMLRVDPDVADMRPEVLTQPRQTLITPQQFTVDSDGKTYLITAFFDYDQPAMVVSTNNKLALKPVLQLFRSRDLLNVNDLCVVWGSNVATGVYRDMTFHQGAYTCYPRYKEGRASAAALRYRGDQLAHNHILSNDPKLKRALRSLRKGDQIRLKGKLVAYAHQGQVIRVSSFVRDDNVCETIWLEELEILRRHRPVLRVVMISALIAAAGFLAGIIYITYRLMTMRDDEMRRKWMSWGRG